MADEKVDKTVKSPNKSKLANVFEQAEEERKRRLLASRFEIARSGVKAYEKGDYKQAVKDFQTYIHIIEEVKDVGPGELLPKHFDLEKDEPEVMMLCGVLWDLIKIYDHMSSEEKKAEFLVYLNKYVLLCRGMRFEHVASESIRKYVSTGHGKNIVELKLAYASITNSRCFVATSLLDLIEPRTIIRLRVFRDQALENSKTGKKFVAVYYKCGPRLAKILNASPHFIRRVTAKILDQLSRVLDRFGSSPY